MPKYLKNIRHIVERHEVERMMALTLDKRNRSLIACLYLTGARPCEVTAIRGRDLNLEIPLSPGYFALTIPTAKLAMTTDFIIPERTLEIPYNAPFADDFLEYAAGYPEAARLYGISPQMVKKIVYKASEDKLCPYHFRHSRLTKLSREGASVDQLMAWKGSRDTRSVGAYLASKPINQHFKLE